MQSGTLKTADTDPTDARDLEDESLVGELYIEHRVRLRAWFARLCRRADRLDDLVQEVFLQLGRRLSCQVREPVRDPVALLYHIAGNVLTDQLRRQLSIEKATEPLHPYVTRLHDPGLALDELLCREEAIEKRRAIVQKLPDLQRRVVLFQVSGLKPAEIAGQMNLEVTRVYDLLRNAYRRCQRQLHAIGLSDDKLY